MPVSTYTKKRADIFMKISPTVLSMMSVVLARLLSFNNVIVTSHQAFFTREAVHNIAETTLQNIADFEAGRPLENEVKH